MGPQRRPPDADQSTQAGRSDELQDVLSDPYGRNAVVYLGRQSGPVDIAELARGVVGLLGDDPAGGVGSDVVRRVQTWLHHGHLPTLQRHGIVEYDPDDGTVELVADGRSTGRREPDESESR